MDSGGPGLGVVTWLQRGSKVRAGDTPSASVPTSRAPASGEAAAIGNARTTTIDHIGSPNLRAQSGVRQFPSTTPPKARCPNTRDYAFGNRRAAYSLECWPGVQRSAHDVAVGCPQSIFANFCFGASDGAPARDWLLDWKHGPGHRWQRQRRLHW